MSQYKLLACDVDGTLLNSDSKLTKQTLSGLRRIIENDIVFCISSGRGILALEFLYSLFQENIPCITFNGALVTFSKTQEVLYEQHLKASDAQKIMEVGLQAEVMFICWEGTKLYTNIINEDTLRYAAMSNVEPIKINNIKDLKKKKFHKIIFQAEIAKINKIQNTLQINSFSKVDFYTSLPQFLEFVHSDASKGVGLREIAKYLSIDKEEVIAIGDGYNDLSMIEYAGLGIAMANAPLDIKKKAQFVTSSNDEDGVLAAINKFILKNKC